ncbi:hypothetical protein YC2023_119229 [Brassica napus]
MLGSHPLLTIRSSILLASSNRFSMYQRSICNGIRIYTSCDHLIEQLLRLSKLSLFQKTINQSTESDNVGGDFPCNHIPQQLCTVIPSSGTTEASYERVVGNDISFDPFGFHFIKKAKCIVEAPIFAKTIDDHTVCDYLRLDLSMFHLPEQIQGQCNVT